MALGDELPDELVLPRFKPAARDPLPDRAARAAAGRARAADRAARQGARFPGVVQADAYLQVGETIRPVRLDGDRRGYVIAIADTNLEALDRAEAAAKLLDVEVDGD